MIEFENVTMRYGDLTVLDRLSLRITERRVAVVGANGSGKSTFARLLNGLVSPTEGTVRIDGLSTTADARAVRRKVGFVFQNPDNQIVYPLVEEDIAFGLKNLKLPKAEIAARVDAVLARYGMEHLRQRSAHLLSGGQKQMLAISAVLVMEPAYVRCSTCGGRLTWAPCSTRCPFSSSRSLTTLRPPPRRTAPWWSTTAAWCSTATRLTRWRTIAT